MHQRLVTRLDHPATPLCLEGFSTDGAANGAADRDPVSSPRIRAKGAMAQAVRGFVAAQRSSQDAAWTKLLVGQNGPQKDS